MGNLFQKKLGGLIISTEQIGENKNNGKAVTSFVLGIAGILGWIIPLIGAPITIIGLILGIIGRKSQKKKLAAAGLVLSIIFLVATIVNASIGAYKGANGTLFSPKTSSSTAAKSTKTSISNKSSVSDKSTASDQSSSSDNSTAATSSSSDNSSSTESPDSDSAQTYLNSVKPIALKLDDIVQQFNQLREQSKNGQITDEDFAQKLEDMVTQLNDQNDQLLKLQETAPGNMQQPNMTLSTSIQDLSGSFLDYIAAVDNGDTSKIADGNSLLSKSNQEQLDFVNQVKSAQ